MEQADTFIILPTCMTIRNSKCVSRDNGVAQQLTGFANSFPVAEGIWRSQSWISVDVHDERTAAGNARMLKECSHYLLVSRDEDLTSADLWDKVDANMV